MASAARDKAFLGYAMANLLPDYQVRTDLISPPDFFKGKSQAVGASSGSHAKPRPKKTTKGERNQRADPVDKEASGDDWEGEDQEDRREEA